MALQKDFKVKDTINVGLSGIFASGIRIGTAGEYYTTDYTSTWNTVAGANTPAIDAWGPILSAGVDLAEYIGDSLADLEPGSEQSYVQYITQENQDPPGSGTPWVDVKVTGLGTWDSPTFEGLALSGSNGTAVISGANTIILDPGGYGNTSLDTAGVVRIKGDLYVDGTTTTINSSQISLSDTVITLGTSAGDDENLVNITQASALPTGGAGIEIGSITGATILYKQDGEWDIGSTTNISGNVTTTGSGSIGTTLDVTGGTTLGSTLDVTGGTTLESTLNVSGAAGFDGTLSLSGDFGVYTDNSETTVFSIAQATGNTTTSGSVTIAGGLSVTEQTASEFTGTITTSGDITVHALPSDDITLTIDADTGVLSGSSTGTFEDVTARSLTENKIVIAGTGGKLEDSVIESDGTTTTISSGLSATGTTTLDSNTKIKSDATVEGNLVLSGADLSAASKAGVWTGSSGTDVASAPAIATLSTTGINAAKFVIAVDSGASGKSVIEVLATVTDSNTIDGTAYGQVDTETTPTLQDLDLGIDSGRITIKVQTGTDAQSVTIFGTGYYN